MAKNQKYTIKLTNEQRAELNKVAYGTRINVSAETKARAKAILYLDELGEKPLNPDKTAKKAKLHRQTVYDLRKQFVTEGLEVAIYRKQRELPPVAPKVTGDVQAHIIATACSAPPEGKSGWSLTMIANKVMLEGVIESVSHETVRKVLKKRSSNPI